MSVSVGGDDMRTREAGFTLVEALVAMAVFTLVVSAVYQGFTSSWRGLRRAESADLALSVAEARLASTGIETPLEASQQSGVSPEGIRWTADINPYVPPSIASDAATAQRSAVAGYWVTVTVYWTDGPLRPGQSLQLKTVKLKRAQP